MSTLRAEALAAIRDARDSDVDELLADLHAEDKLTVIRGEVIR